MYFLLLILLSVPTFASQNLHESPKWHKLLHYKKNLLGGFESQTDGKKFFLSSEGKTNPKKELLENIKAFESTTTPGDDDAICKFPLRYKWLNKELGYPWKADLSGCHKYLSFFSKLAAKRASIIFSSYYLTNPNSAFGHTLLRLSRFDDRNETEMLDYGINYAASAKETNPFLYAVKGLFGGFTGEFAAVPYYYKVREYSDFEFRDIWSYDLKLTMPEVLEMVDHIWELGQTHFDYFYFHENCSYHLLSVIDVARPDLNLTDEYSLYAIPADTVRLLRMKGLIEKGKKRESTYSRLIRLSRDLNEKELKSARKIAENSKDALLIIKEYDEKRGAAVLDSSMEAFDYFNSEKILKDDEPTLLLKSYILKARAINPVVSDDRIFKGETLELDSPALSHSPTRLSLSEKYDSQWGKSTRFEFRAALHDLLDPPHGSMKEAQIEMGKFIFEIKDQSFRDPKLLFSELSVLNIKNFPEQNFWSSPFSWEIDVGGKQLLYRQCFDCPAFYLNGSVGNSIQLFQQRALLAILLNSELDIQSQFVNNYALGLGPKFYGRFKFSDHTLMAYSSTYHFNTYEHQKVFQDYAWWNELEVRQHLNDRFSIFTKGQGIERDHKWLTSFEIGLQYFYE